jgi:hypothetical protein
MTSSPDQNPQDNRQPIVVQQGGNGTAIGLIVAALILAGGAIWAVTIWSDTQLKMIEAPAEAIKEGMKGAAEALKPGS